MANDVAYFEKIVAKNRRQKADSQEDLKTIEPQIRPLWLEAEGDDAEARVAGRQAEKLERTAVNLRAKIKKTDAIIEDAQAKIVELKKQEAEALRQGHVEAAIAAHSETIAKGDAFINHLIQANIAYDKYNDAIEAQKKALAKAGLGSLIGLFHEPRHATAKFSFLSQAPSLAYAMGATRFVGAKPGYCGSITKLKAEDAEKWRDRPSDAEARAVKQAFKLREHENAA